MRTHILRLHIHGEQLQIKQRKPYMHYGLISDLSAMILLFQQKRRTDWWRLT